MTGTPAAAKEKEDAIEYSIYAYHHPANKKEGQNDWEMIHQTTNMEEAMKKAEALHESGDYHKVEVKKKYFDEKNNRKIDMTLKLYEGSAKQPIGTGILVALALACGVAAFGFTLLASMFLNGQASP